MRGARWFLPLLLLGAAGCAPVRYVPQAPPPPRVETPPPAPEGDFVWRTGHWKWTGRRYAWVPGRWVKAEGADWEAGHWVKRPRGWIYLPGHRR